MKKSWQKYVTDSKNELPRPDWMNFPPVLIPLIMELRNKRLFFDYRMVKRYIAALASNRFVIFSGVSGTGKTTLSSNLADVTGATSAEKHAFVEVGANWKNNQYVIGYWDNLASPPQHRDGEVLRTLKHAQLEASAQEPHFITLDEMNLSYVEWYFSDYLSAMQREPAYRLIKYSADGNPGSGTIRIGDNVFLTGTINMDHTTQGLSPKVIDRAHIIELTASKPDSYWGNDTLPLLSLGHDVAEDLRISLSKYLIRARVRGEAEIISATPWGKHVIGILCRIWSILEPVGLHFGARPIADILVYMEAVRELHVAAAKTDWNDELSEEVLLALDEALVQKIIPKIYGQRNRIEAPLKSLEELLKTEFALIVTECLTLTKIRRMLTRSKEGYTSFFGS